MTDVVPPEESNRRKSINTHIAVSTVYYFGKKSPSQMFDWVENRLQARSLKY